MAEAPGWEAIDAACERVYGKQQPLHWGTLIPARLGGPDPLDGISAYHVEDPSHWHFVTYGMSELYEKESDDAELSGWGFEFTMRLERPEGEDSPPAWALNFLQNLARYVEGSGNWFEPGHHMNLNGPIALDSDTELTGVLFDEDQTLGSIETPHGELQFLQVIAVTEDELNAAVQWNAKAFAKLLGESDRRHIIRLGRSSYLDSPAIAARFDEGMSRDGSSCGVLFGGKMSWGGSDPLVLTFGALQMKSVLRVLSGRIPFGKELSVVGEDESVVTFQPSASNTVEVDGDKLNVALTSEGASALVAAIKPLRGRYATDFVPGIVVEVQPTEITGQDGSVVEVIG